MRLEKRIILICFLCLAVCSGCGQPANDLADAETPAVIEAANKEAVDHETEPVSGAEEQGTSETAAEEEPTETEAQDPSVVTICMVGDILLHDPVEEAAERDDGTYDFSHIFSETEQLIEDADLAIVNQEVILGGKELGVTGYPAFNAPYEVGDALYEAGFDVVLHATNHALDKGGQGIRNCCSYWEEEHPDMEILGIHKSREDQEQIRVIDAAGIEIAILNYTYGTNGISLPEDMPYAVDLMEEERVLHDLKCAEETADITIVCPHWGTEYMLAPDADQEKWTEIFAENGADIIIGTHPHVIQSIEQVADTLVFYSLGNFVNWTSGTGEGVANRMVGGMATITLARDRSGEVAIKDYGITALVTDLREGQDGVTVYPLRAYTQEQADQNLIRRQDPDFSLAYCRNLCDDVWGELWD